MPADFSVARVHEASEVLDVSEPLEPATALVSSAVLEPDMRAWQVTASDGEVAGYLVCSRICWGRWYAYPLVLRADAGPVVARLVDRLRTWAIEGPVEHVEPVVSHMERSGRGAMMPWWGVDNLGPLVEMFPVDERTRLADEKDLDALVDLYSRYELNLIPSVPRLRRHLKGLIATGRRPIAVIEEDGAIVGAFRVEARSRRYAYWSGLTINPKFRGGGRGRALLGISNRITAEMGLGAMAIKAPTNNMRPGGGIRIAEDEEPTFGLLKGVWLTARLTPPKRFTGHHRLRRWWLSLEGRTMPRSARVR